jgi:hypothetical protein
MDLPTLVECQRVAMERQSAQLAEHRARIATLEAMLGALERRAARVRGEDLLLRARAMANCSAAIDLYDLLIERQSVDAAL